MQNVCPLALRYFLFYFQNGFSIIFTHWSTPVFPRSYNPALSLCNFILFRSFDIDTLLKVVRLRTLVLCYPLILLSNV